MVFPEPLWHPPQAHCCLKRRHPPRLLQLLPPLVDAAPASTELAEAVWGSAGGGRKIVRPQGWNAELGVIRCDLLGSQHPLVESRPFRPSATIARSICGTCRRWIDHSEMFDGTDSGCRSGWSRRTGAASRYRSGYCIFFVALPLDFPPEGCFGRSRRTPGRWPRQVPTRVPCRIARLGGRGWDTSMGSSGGSHRQLDTRTA